MSTFKKQKKYKTITRGQWLSSKSNLKLKKSPNNSTFPNPKNLRKNTKTNFKNSGLKPKKNTKN